MQRRCSWLAWAVVTAGLAQPGVSSAQTIGPDAFGYTLTRTNNPGAFVSIKGAGGTPIFSDPPAGTQDDVFFSVPIGFNFSFYGVSSSTAFVSTNGYIAFGGSTATNQALGVHTGQSYGNPNFNSALNITAQGIAGGPGVDRQVIAPWWDDLQFTGGQTGSLYTQTRTVGPLQEFVVEWNNDAFFDSPTSPVTFQAILRSNGTMAFFYPDVTTAFPDGTNGISATIGIHDLNATTADNRFLQHSFNQALALANGDVINVLAPIPEPTSLLLCGVAAVGGLWVRRRRASS